jgi:hypothetical protein
MIERSEMNCFNRCIGGKRERSFSKGKLYRLDTCREPIEATRPNIYSGIRRQRNRFCTSG